MYFPGSVMANAWYLMYLFSSRLGWFYPAALCCPSWKPCTSRPFPQQWSWHKPGVWCRPDSLSLCLQVCLMFWYLVCEKNNHIFLFKYFLFPNNSFYHLLILGKETSTLYTRWCGMERICTSPTYREKLQCIMQWREEACGWNSVQLIERMSEMGFCDWNVLNTDILFCLSPPASQCIICGRQECFTSPTLTCTMWRRFTSQHPHATRRWFAICWEKR